jgi:AmmeMemoRadiSam system protein B
MRLLPALTCALLLLLACGGADKEAPPASFPPLFADPQPFLAAIRKSRAQPRPQRITGLTVPHHLLAADLLADACAAVSRQHYRRIVILSPDHFSRSRTAFAVTGKNFQTALGTLFSDQTAIRHLLTNKLVAVSELFSHEHGVQALLPFLAHYFPQAKIVPLAISQAAKPADWEALAQTLTPLLDSDTLMIQSTDFSHFLPPAEARRRDQETLRVLSGGDSEEVKQLTEPGHLDSRAAQYLQLRLQAEVWGARPTVIANRNSQDYAAEPLTRTTSYMVQLYSPEVLTMAGGEHWFFAGDTFCGRYLAPRLSSPENQDELAARVLKITGGEKLIVNLEGVVREKCPEEAGEPWKLCMETGLTLPLLKKMNVRVVSLANNHVRDFGEDSYQQMKSLLLNSGLMILENGSVTDLGGFRLAAFTDIDNRGRQRMGVLTESDLTCLEGVSRDKPLFALLHWGAEFAQKAGPREETLAARLEAKGVELIIGSHSHRAGGLRCTLRTCRAFSLGNFVFDQRRPEVSGAILEVIFFPQGTYFLRWHPLGNLYAGSIPRK